MTSSIWPHCFGILVMLMTSDRFKNFPFVFAFGVSYVILDLVHHLSGSNINIKIMRPASIALAVLFGAEFIYRLYSEKSALSMNLLFLYSTVLAFLIFLTTVEVESRGAIWDSPLVREDDHAIYHLFVWFVFYAAVTGKSSLYGSLRARVARQ